MRNSAAGTTTPWYQRRPVQGAMALLAIGSGILVFGRDALFFYDGPGGKDWRMGQGGVHLLNAHFDRDMDEARQKALALVNRDRLANGLAPLALDSRLDESAQHHAEDMAQRDFLSNFSPEGTSPSDRFTALGGSGFVAGNIAVQGRDDEITYRRLTLLERAWMYERRDRENVLNPQFNQFGFGIAIDQTDGEVYAVQLFRGEGTAQAPLNVEAATTQVKTTSENPFYHAVNAAMAAATAAQTAQTSQEWARVASAWQTAIGNMEAVAPDHPRHGTAQEKIAEYGKNFDYARSNAGTAFVAQQPATTGVTAADIPTATTPRASATAATARPPASTPPMPQSGQEASQPVASHTVASHTVASPTVDQATPQSQSNGSFWFKLLLTLGGSAVLIFVLTLEPDQLPSRADERSQGREPSQAWHHRAIQEVQRFLEAKGWFNAPPQYKLTDARPAQQLQRKLYRELLSFTQDEQTAISLIKDHMRRNPNKPVNWCCEQVIKDLRQPQPAHSSSSSSGKAASARRSKEASQANSPQT